MSATKKEEVVRVMEERKFWHDFADMLGWKVYGWNYKNSATLINKQGKHHEFTSAERLDVLSTIDREAKRIASLLGEKQ